MPSPSRSAARGQPPPRPPSSPPPALALPRRAHHQNPQAGKPSDSAPPSASRAYSASCSAWGWPAPPPVPVGHDRAALVRVDRGGGQGHGDRPVVQAIRQEHQVGGEPVPAHVRGLPHRPGMPGGQHLRQRPAEPGAARVPLAVRADQVQRVIPRDPDDGMIPAASSFRSRSVSSGADADTCAYLSQGVSPAVQPRNTERTSPAWRRPGRRIKCTRTPNSSADCTSAASGPLRRAAASCGRDPGARSAARPGTPPAPTPSRARAPCGSPRRARKQRPRWSTSDHC